MVKTGPHISPLDEKLAVSDISLLCFVHNSKVSWRVIKFIYVRWLGDMADSSVPQGMFSMCITIKSSLPSLVRL